MKYRDLLASRTEKMGANAIREILKVVSRPGMVSLAGGIPAPESFPMDIIQELTARVLAKYASRAFQYDLTEGFPPLREALVGLLAKRGIHSSSEEILIGSGSQGILDAVGKTLISKGDCVAVEAPTYLGALSAFNPYEPRYVEIATDEEGILPQSLEKILTEQKVKFVYLVPNFQNPSGRTIPFARRKQIADLIVRHRVLVVEDDPYGALRYRGEDIPLIKTLAPENVVYISTFSKIFAPGLRIGFFIAPPLIARWLVLVKQGVDLHTSTFNQALAAEYLSGGYLDQHLPKVIRIYKPRQEAMLGALQQYFPDSFKWSKPEGGMFIWVEGPPGFDAEKLYGKAIEKNVAFVPGKYFYTAAGQGLGTMRLNFTMADEKTLDQAVQVLGQTIREMA